MIAILLAVALQDTFYDYDPQTKSGDERVLALPNKLAKDQPKKIEIFTQRTHIDTWEKSKKADDDVGLKELTDKGHAVLADLGTKVKVLSRFDYRVAGDRLPCIELRVMDGPHKDKKFFALATRACVAREAK